MTVAAVSLAMFGISRDHQDFMVPAQQSFAKALIATRRAIEDPVESLRDETLLAVLLLSLFEVSNPPNFASANNLRK